jgi:RNA polymerase sigma-70 factor (ECF subfamily)
MVSTLLEHYRQVLILFYLQEKSYEEVSDMLDLPLGTVKTYLHRARKELARLVEEEQTRAKRKTESYHGVPKV